MSEVRQSSAPPSQIKLAPRLVKPLVPRSSPILPRACAKVDQKVDGDPEAKSGLELQDGKLRLQADGGEPDDANDKIGRGTEFTSSTLQETSAKMTIEGQDERATQPMQHAEQVESHERRSQASDQSNTELTAEESNESTQKPESVKSTGRRSPATIIRQRSLAEIKVELRELPSIEQRKAVIAKKIQGGGSDGEEGEEGEVREVQTIPVPPPPIPRRTTPPLRTTPITLQPSSELQSDPENPTILETATPTSNTTQKLQTFSPVKPQPTPIPSAIPKKPSPPKPSPPRTEISPPPDETCPTVNGKHPSSPLTPQNPTESSTSPKRSGSTQPSPKAQSESNAMLKKPAVPKRHSPQVKRKTEPSSADTTATLPQPLNATSESSNSPSMPESPMRTVQAGPSPVPAAGTSDQQAVIKPTLQPRRKRSIRMGTGTDASPDEKDYSRPESDNQKETPRSDLPSPTPSSVTSDILHTSGMAPIELQTTNFEAADAVVSNSSVVSPPAPVTIPHLSTTEPPTPPITTSPTPPSTVQPPPLTTQSPPPPAYQSPPTPQPLPTSPADAHNPSVVEPSLNPPAAAQTPDLPSPPTIEAAQAETMPKPPATPPPPSSVHAPPTSLPNPPSPPPASSPPPSAPPTTDAPPSPPSPQPLTPSPPASAPPTTEAPPSPQPLTPNPPAGLPPPSAPPTTEAPPSPPSSQPLTPIPPASSPPPRAPPTTEALPSPPSPQLLTPIPPASSPPPRAPHIPPSPPPAYATLTPPTSPVTQTPPTTNLLLTAQHAQHPFLFPTAAAKPEPSWGSGSLTVSTPTNVASIIKCGPMNTKRDTIRKKKSFRRK